MCPEERRHTVAVVGVRHIVADGAHLGRSIAHGNARAGRTQHPQIVGAVPEGDGVLRRDAQALRECKQSPALIRIGGIELKIIAKRRRDQNVRKRGRDLCARRFALCHVPKTQLHLLHRLTVCAHKRFQILDRRTCAPQERDHFLIGVMADKDVSHILEALTPIAASFVAVRPNNPRAMAADELRDRILAFGAEATACQTVQEGVEKVIEQCGKDGIGCALGSLYMSSDVRACFNQYHQI